jgi:exopolysaccharide biosynthesis polyprenyl glycosylphosphotransferase
VEKVENITNEKTNNQSKSFFKRRSWAILFQFLADNIAFASTFLIFYLFIFESGAVERRGIPEKQLILFGVAFLNTYWMLIYFFAGLYKNWYERSPFDEYYLVIKTTLFGTALIYLTVIFDTNKPPRMMAIYYFLVLTGFSLFFRTLIRRLQKRLRKKRIIAFKTLIIGRKDHILEAIQKMTQSPSWGLEPYGGICSDGIPPDDDLILGTVENLPFILDEHQPDVLVITRNDLSDEILFQVAQLANERNIRVKIEPNLYSIFTGQSKTQNLYGIPYIEINPKLMSNWELFGKRIFDIVFSILVIIIGLPIWIGIAIAIKLSSKGPVFYTQPRIGLNGKEFKFWKFRSMRPTTKYEANWTKVGDPRVTKIGKFIRKTHLDEVPQFWNVIIGDMSVVGPRPEQPKFVENFQKEIPYYKRRHIVRPGITGWWQVSYKPHVLDTEEIKGRLKEDFYYIENMSLKFDIEIIIRTVWTVLSGHGQT